MNKALKWYIPIFIICLALNLWGFYYYMFLSENIAIATDGYHQLRARIIANRQGKSGKVGAVNAKPIKSVILTYWVREWFAIPVELIK